MRGFWKLTWTELKLFLREPTAAFFTLAFPVLMLFLFGSIYGNKSTPFFGGYGSVDVSVPGYAAMIIATSGLLSLTIFLAAYCEYGILRPLQATPLRPQAILGAEVVVVFLMTTLGMILLLVAAKSVYGLRFAGNAVSVAGAYLLSCASFFALGFVVAGLLPTTRTAQVVAMVLFYPMIFLSGATLPREILPESVRRVAQVLPLTHVVSLLRGLWIGEPWARHFNEVGILAIIFLTGVAVSAKTFRWE
ncbi:MAG: ABC transporter permease [bacterium]|jgi:ABC-2 type transport system permease protein|nr:ABC transporter permease [candidate division KSB1 bacterium]MDH7561405.1 ABC transporter permease [bacterium]